MSIKLSSLVELADQYREALAWLSAKGVRIESTRLAKYERTLRQAAADEAQKIENHQGDPEFVNAVVEASEIIDVARLDPSAFDQPHPADKLRQISNGPAVMAANAPDRGRDYAFEFACAEILHRVGRFGGFSASSGDLIMDPHRAPLECKRISSLRQIEKRLREARDQLVRAKKSGASPGIIVVDLTNPIRTHQGCVEAADDSELLLVADQQLTAYLMEYVFSESLFASLCNPAVLGLFFRNVSVGHAGAVSSIRRSTTWHVCSLNADDTDEDRLFQTLAANFGNVPLANVRRNDIVAARSAIRTPGRQ